MYLHNTVAIVCPCILWIKRAVTKNHRWGKSNIHRCLHPNAITFWRGNLFRFYLWLLEASKKRLAEQRAHSRTLVKFVYDKSSKLFQIYLLILSFLGLQFCVVLILTQIDLWWEKNLWNFCLVRYLMLILKEWGWWWCGFQRKLKLSFNLKQVAFYSSWIDIFANSLWPWKYKNKIQKYTG